MLLRSNSLALGIIFCITAFGQAAIINGDFENGLTGWSQGGSIYNSGLGTLSLVSTGGTQGPHYAHISAVPDFGGMNRTTMYQLVTVASGDVLAFDYQSPNQSPSHTDLVIEKNVVWTDTILPLAASHAWQSYSCQFPESGQFWVIFSAEAQAPDMGFASCVLNIDNVRFVPEPGMNLMLSLSAACFAIFAWVRRKRIA